MITLEIHGWMLSNMGCFWSVYFSIMDWTGNILVKGCLQILLQVLREFKQIN